MFGMPGKAWEGPLPEHYCDDCDAIVATIDETLSYLCDDLGPRHVHDPTTYAALDAARVWFVARLEDAGYEDVDQQVYMVGDKEVANVSVEIPGTERPEEIVVVGAHYDTIPDCVGANDNGTGLATTLFLARYFADKPQPRTLRFVFFVNEEVPFFHTERMGSYVYAERCAADGDDIVAMLCPETLGYYSDEPGSQSYPGHLEVAFGDVGNFLAVIGDSMSSDLVRGFVRGFRDTVKFPCEGAVLPRYIDGVGWSDHWSFWQFDFPAIMLTDTAPFRYPHYHTSQDTPDKVDYDKLARAIHGIRGVVERLGDGDIPTEDGDTDKNDKTPTR
jgi:Zn-dependent M28 family amino/carboxypeptidase